ncbi:MAG: ABC transporter substrate-binding protein, partial [Spirochaetales bacterium]|nr:ABC transporter substrate-binding protein [Spirochaetales bacterium]
MKKVFVVLLVSVLAVCGLFAAAASESASDTIKIAYVGPMTGDQAEYGITMSNAIKIAIDDLNAQGDTLGKKLELVIFDDKNDATEATTAAEKACSEKGVVGVIGHFSSGVAMAAAEVYQENGVPYIAISAAHPDLCEGSFIFRNNALYDTEASSMLQTVAYKGAKKFGILVQNSDAGVSVTTQMNNWLEKFGDKYEPELATIQKFDAGATDFSAQVQAMIAAGCEVVYTNADYAVAVPFIKQYRDYDPNVQFIVSAACFGPTFIDAAGKYADGVVLATSFFYGSANAIVKQFVEKYNKTYGADPNNFAGQSYDAALSIKYALDIAGKA